MLTDRSPAPLGTRHLPPPRIDDWSWHLRGRCRGYPSEVFFPENEDRQSRRGREAAAKQICDGCAVLALCRDHALNTPEVHGIWGAMTARERARLLSHHHRRLARRGRDTAPSADHGDSTGR